MSNKALKRLVVLFIQKDVNVELLATEIDNLIKWRNVSWLPPFMAKWLERNDDGLIGEIAVLLVEVRQELLNRGALILTEP